MSLACLPRHPAVANLGLVGVELYFEDLPRARAFYQEVLGLELAETQEGHHVKLMTPGGFICVDRQAVAVYLSADKAVVFFEVTKLSHALERIGADRVIRRSRRGPDAWAVLPDPDGHNLLLVERTATSA